ncbi:MAG TPA: ribbon-helix-helix protein, CopG family [Polyangiaceae bacterium]
MTSVVKTVKIPKPVAAALSRLAKAQGRSESELIRQGIEAVLRDDDGVDMQKALAADLGVGRGPKDLSSNRKRLAGYGRSRHR